MGIFSTSGFQGLLTKLSFKGYPYPVINLTIKHICEGDLQDFLSDMEKTLNIKHVAQLFETDVQWDKMVISSNLSHKVTVEFDEVEFDAILKSINIARKMKNGVESYIYILNFEKEVSSTSIDKTLVVEYLNRKEENEDGKEVLVKYQVKLTSTPDATTEEVF